MILGVIEVIVIGVLIIGSVGTSILGIISYFYWKEKENFIVEYIAQNVND